MENQGDSIGKQVIGNFLEQEVDKKRRRLLAKGWEAFNSGDVVEAAQLCVQLQHFIEDEKIETKYSRNKIYRLNEKFIVSYTNSLLFHDLR